MPDLLADFDLTTAEDMALNKQDKEWIESAISDSIRDHYRSRIAKFRDWFPAGAAVAVVLFVLVQWNSYTVFRTHADDRLHTIDDHLQTIEARLLNLSPGVPPLKTLSEIGRLQPKALSEALPALRRATQRPVSGLTPATVRGIGHGLAQVNEQMPDYWHTVLQFIQSASTGGSSLAPAPGGPQLSFHNMSLQGIAFKTEGRTIVLDGVSIENVVFKGARIVFTNNPIRMKNVLFIDCAFEFPSLDDPPEYIKEAGRLLLASDLKSVTLRDL